MSYRDVHGRRLNLRAALQATLRAMPRLWLGAWGVLIAASATWALPVFMADRIALGGWSAGVATTLTLVAVGALARLSISATIKDARALGLGRLGFQFKWPELRLVGAALLCLIFLAMIVALLALVVLAIFGVAELDVAAIKARDWAAVGPAWKLVVLAGVGVGALLIPLLLSVRLSLFVPATLGRRQMVSLNSMGIAYGSFWQILGGLIITGAPIVVVAILTGTGALEGQVAVVSRIGVLFSLQLPLTIAFLGAAYRQLEYWSPEEPRS